MEFPFKSVVDLEFLREVNLLTFFVEFYLVLLLEFLFYFFPELKFVLLEYVICLDIGILA